MKIADKLVLDDVRWYAAYLDTPMWISPSRTPEEAARKPGCSVKSREREPHGNRFPVHHGKLVSFDDAADKVVVRGHNNPISPRFVWEGMVWEYLALWECD